VADDEQPARAQGAPDPAPPDTRRASSAEKTVAVAVAYPHDIFETNVKGVPPLTREPIDVAAKSLAKVKEAAAATGVPLVIDGEDKE
jgi:hypothetical protein